MTPSESGPLSTSGRAIQLLHILTVSGNQTHHLWGCLYAEYQMVQLEAGEEAEGLVKGLGLETEEKDEEEMMGLLQRLRMFLPFLFFPIADSYIVFLLHNKSSSE